jgi:predicted RNA methylase
VSHLTMAHLGPPSKTLIGMAVELTSLSQYPVLDAGCGVGRNAVALASHGFSVVCVDHERDRLNSLIRVASLNNNALKRSVCELGRLYPVLADLKHSQWPFSQNCFGAIICVSSSMRSTRMATLPSVVYRIASEARFSTIRSSKAGSLFTTTSVSE